MAFSPETQLRNLLLPESSWEYWFIAPLAGVSWGFFLIRLLTGYSQIPFHLTVALVTLLCGLLLGRRQWRGGREVYMLGIWGVILVLTMLQSYTAGLAFLLFGVWLPGRKVLPRTGKLFFVAFFAGCAAGYFMPGNGIAPLAIVLLLDFMLNSPLPKRGKSVVLLLFAAAAGIFMGFTIYAGSLKEEKVTRSGMPPIALLCGIGCSDPAETMPQVVIITADKVSAARKFFTGEPIGLSVEFADVNIRKTDNFFGLVDVIAVEDFLSGNQEFVSRILMNMNHDTVLVAPEAFARLAPQLQWQTLPGEGRDKFVIARRGGSVQIAPEKIEKRLLALSGGTLCPAGTFHGLMFGFKSTLLLPEKASSPPASSRWWLLILPLAVAVMEIFTRRKKYDIAIVSCWENAFILGILSVAYCVERGEMSSGSQILFLILSSVWLAASLSLRDLPLLILKLAAALMVLGGFFGYSGMVKAAFVCAGMVMAVENARVRREDLALKLPSLLTGMICGLIPAQFLLFRCGVALPHLLALVFSLQIWSMRHRFVR